MPHIYGVSERSASNPHGISQGEDDSEKTTRKIWEEAEARAIADTRANRNLAYEIDALVNIILEFEAFTILGSYEIHSSNDEDHSDLIQRIDSFLKDIKLLSSFREAFPAVRIHGAKYLQKRYEPLQTRLAGEPKGLLRLQQLVAVEKHIDPFDSDNYYLFQNLKIEEDWKDPKTDLNTEIDWDDQKKYRLNKQKVWYIKDGVNGIAAYPKISLAAKVDDPNNARGDIVVDLEDIIEIKNNESGRSSLTAALNEVFIKNHILLNLPNLVYLVVAPGVGVECQTHDKDGNWIVPHYPLAELNESNPEAYQRELSDYRNFETEKQNVANHLIDNWFKKGVMVYSDMMKPMVIESQQRFQAEMLQLMMQILNKEIAFALGFPISLLDARGVEMATGREIRAVMATVLRGIQNQYKIIARDIIYEQFQQEAEAAEITFELTELNPKEAKELAEVRAMDATILKIFKEIGASDDDLRALSRQYDILDECELGGSGAVQGAVKTESEVPYSAEDLKLSLDVVRRIAADKASVAISKSDLL